MICRFTAGQVQEDNEHTDNEGEMMTLKAVSTRPFSDGGRGVQLSYMVNYRPSKSSLSGALSNQTNDGNTTSVRL